MDKVSETKNKKPKYYKMKRRYLMIVARAVYCFARRGDFELEDIPRDYQYYMQNHLEFYQRYCPDLGEFCPQSYTKKQRVEAATAILEYWIEVENS